MPQTLQQRVIEALTPAPVWTKDDIILWRPFDAAPVVYYVRFLGDSACKVNVKGPHDAEPVQAMLREIAPADLPPPEGEPLIALAPSPALAGTPFALRAIVSPTLANGALAKTVQFMAPMTRTAFPAYRCEFPEGDTREELASASTRWWSGRTGRASRRRRSAPAFQRLKSGVRSTGGKALGRVPLAGDREDPRLPGDGGRLHGAAQLRGPADPHRARRWPLHPSRPAASRAAWPTMPCCPG